MIRRILCLLILMTAVAALGACGYDIPGRGVAAPSSPAPSASPTPTVVATQSAAPEPTASPAGGGAEAYAVTLEELVNDEREAAGLAPLVHDDCAAGFAQERAQALVGAAELKHAPLGSVLDGCEVNVAGENLSRGNSTPEDVVEAWMDSPGHEANIVKPEFAGAAIACALEGGTETAPLYLCSQVFLGG